MSHPPETSLTSRELAERIHDLWMNKEWEDINPYAAAAALIEAWVRVREAQAKRDQHQSEHSCENTTRGAWDGYNCKILAGLESAIATARKQLEGGTHGQTEAPSAAASANSEPRRI